MAAIWRGYINASLILKITVAFVVGIIIGIIFGEQTIILAPLGDLLIRLLKFLIIPLVLFTIIVGVNQTRIGDLGRIGGKVFLYYVLTSALAITIGLAVASFFAPGSGMDFDNTGTFEVPENPGIIQVLLNIIPANIVTAFSELNLLGIIFTAIVFGIAISYLRASKEHAKMGEHLYKVVEGLNEATLSIMKGFLQYLPIGIFAIIAKTVGNQGMDALLSLGNVIAVLYVALFVQIGIYIIFMLLYKVRPGQFFAQAQSPMITAFVTQSSTGTLPITLDAAKKLGISKSLYGFSLPLGATINMDGAAIRIAVSAVFAANLVGNPLNFTDMLVVILVGTLASIGTAGVPGAGIIMIATVFAQVGLPMETVALLTAIDAIVGMGATALNVTGDLVGTAIIDKTEKRKKYPQSSLQV